MFVVAERWEITSGDAICENQDAELSISMYIYTRVEMWGNQDAELSSISTREDLVIRYAMHSFESIDKMVANRCRGHYAKPVEG